MGFYKSKIGFFRKTLLKLITRMEKITFMSRFHNMFVLFNRLHFFVYTGMYLPKAFSQGKPIAIAATRRVKILLDKSVDEKFQGCFPGLMKGIVYRIFLVNTMNRKVIDVLLNKKMTQVRPINE